MFTKEKPKGSPRPRYFLWLIIGLAIGMIAVMAGFFSLFEPHRNMQFTEIANIHHDDYLRYASYSPDNEFIFSYSELGGFLTSDTKGSELSRFHEEGLTFDIQWNPGKTHFLLTDQQQNAILFDNEGNRIMGYEHSGIYYAQWNTTGSRIMSISPSDALLWTVDGQLLHSFPQPLAYYDIFQWSPDGTRLVMWEIAGDGALYDADGNLLNPIPLSGHPASYAWNSTNSHFAIAQYIPDTINRLLITVYDRDGLPLWEEEMRINSLQLSWSPDGTRLAALDMSEGKAKLWTADGENLNTFETGMIFSWQPDGENLLVGSRNGQDMRYLDKDGEVLQILPHAGDSFSYPQWSPNGDYLATWTNQLESGFASLLIWDTEGNLLHEFRESSPISFVYWSPDSSRILSVGGYIARLWSMAGGEINSLHHSQPIYHAQWSSDGNRILTVGGYGSTLIENAIWTGEGEHLATLFTGDSNQMYILDWRDDLGQALVQQKNELGIYNLEPGSIYFSFRFGNP